MAKQEDLDYKLQFPQKNFNYLYENSGRILGVPITDSNKRHLKLSSGNESNDEDQGVTGMICNLFQQQGAAEVKVNNFSGDTSEYQY